VGRAVRTRDDRGLPMTPAHHVVAPLFGPVRVAEEQPEAVGPGRWPGPRSRAVILARNPRGAASSPRRRSQAVGPT